VLPRQAYDEALGLIDDALKITRASIADTTDVSRRADVISLLLEKAQTLADAGRHDDALAIVEEALTTAGGLPDGNWRTALRRNVLYIKADVLKRQGHIKEGEVFLQQATALAKEADAIRNARKHKSFAANTEGNTHFTNAARLSGTDRSAEFERARDKYQESVREDLLDPVVWGNLRGACSALASEHAKRAENAGTSRAPDEQKQEAAQRCAIESAWMAWVLSDDVLNPTARSARLKTLYEDRRSLALLLRNDPARVVEALRLAEQGIREAAALKEQNPSPEELSVLADAYYGLGMMREESKREGWEEAMRAGIGYGERLSDREPRTASHLVWIGQVRTELAKRLETGKRPGAATERALAQQLCQDALRVAKTPDDRKSAQSCVDDSRQ